MTEAIAVATPPAMRRKVGVLLGVGILFLPYIFSWMLLRRGYSTLARVVSFGWMLSVIIVALARTPSQTSPTEQVSRDSNSPNSASPAAANGQSSAGSQPSEAAKVMKSNWSYDEATDQMRGITTKYATTQSDEGFPSIFGFGHKSTTLAVHKEKHGYQVELQNDNLQFTCNNFSDTYVSVKFDTGPIQRYGCTDSVGNKFGVAFVIPGSRFVQKLRTSKKVVVEAEIYQKGNVQMTFEVDGLKL